MQGSYMENHTFLDNSLLEIYPNRDELWVNRTRLRGVHYKDHVVILFLAVAALKWPGRSFRAKEIEKEMESNSVLVPGIIWPEQLTAGDIHTAVHKLRKALSRQGLNQWMIERMSDRRNRLGIPLCNISIFDNAGSPLPIPGIYPLTLPAKFQKPKPKRKNQQDEHYQKNCHLPSSRNALRGTVARCGEKHKKSNGTRKRKENGSGEKVCLAQSGV